MDRHTLLYQQGLESIQRKYESIRYAEETRSEAELRDCSFAPFFMRTKAFNMNTPRLYERTVQRLRKGADKRERLNELLTPRVPMTDPAPATTPKRTTKALPPSVTVEVTRDGPGGSIILVGKFTLYACSDPRVIAAKFARINHLTDAQRTRLESELLQSINTAFHN